MAPSISSKHAVEDRLLQGEDSLSEPNSAASGQSVNSANLTKILRLLSLLLVGLSFVIIHFFNVGQIGDSMRWKD